MQAKLCKNAILRAALAAALLLCLTPAALAADEQSAGTSVYCFSESDFSQTSDEEMTGIFVLSVPDSNIGKICFGDRVIRPGDVLPAGALGELTLKTCCTQDGEAVMNYLPVFGDQLGASTRLAINIRSGKAGVPIARNLSLQTYKNIANDGVLKAEDEGGGTLTFQIVTQPKLGTVTLSENGKFVYTPEKNKVGTDTFTYTATDADGNTSEPATVTITILKPTDKATYSDMEGSDDAFEAMWLRESGLYTGSTIGGKTCFFPEQSVTRGEFLVMAMKLMDCSPEDASLRSGFADEEDAPAWMRPYMTTAMRRGYVSGTASAAGLMFSPNDPITPAAAAVILQNMLQLSPTGTAEVFAEDSAVPTWAQNAVSILRQNDLPVSTLNCTEPMSRAEAARLLYAVSSVISARGED